MLIGPPRAAFRITSVLLLIDFYRVRIRVAIGFAPITDTDSPDALSCERSPWGNRIASVYESGATSPHSDWFFCELPSYPTLFTLDSLSLSHGANTNAPATLDPHRMSAAVASTMGNVVLDLPGALVAILLNNTLPPIMDDIFSTDFAAVAKEIEPIFAHGLVAYDTIYCAALEDDDQSSPDGCTPDEYRSRGVSLIQAVLENVQEMSPPTSGTNNKPTSGLVQRMVQYYNWVETDIGSETWTKLHSKCIDTVNRFFQIKWDQSYPGVCNTNTSMWGLNVTHSGYAAGNHDEPGECECSMGEDDDDDKYPKPSTKCRVGHNEDCTCYVHRWESQVFNKEARKAAMTVCDSLAGVSPPSPPSPSAGKAGASVVGSQPRVSKSNLYRSVPRDE